MLTRRSAIAAVPLALLALAVRVSGSSRGEPPLAPDRGDAADHSAPRDPAHAPPPPQAPGRVSHAPRSGFGIQYWGDRYTAAGLADAPHCALIIEASLAGAESPTGRERLFTADEVARIRRGGERPVYAYLNVAELEPNRDYWVARFGTAADPGAPDASSPAWYAGTGPSGEWLAAYWTPEWAAILERRIDAFLARGYDGVFLDDVLHYYTWSSPGVAVPTHAPAPKRSGDFAAAMMALVRKLGHYARLEAVLRNPGFVVVVNGGAFIGWDAATGDIAPTAPHPAFANYLASIDGIAIESVLGDEGQQATLDALRQGFASHGIPVLTIDYLSRQADADYAAFTARMAERAAALGFLPYVAANESFSRLDPPVLPSGTLTPAGSWCARPAPAPADRAGAPT
ncbi:MAG: endo alpha-1,4 polygalactosaminidase [Amaricoccus sp.]